MDIYLPGLPSLADDFGVSASLVQVTIASFLIGLGAGQLVSGPLSDVLGRRRPLLVALVLYTVSSLVCATAPGIGVLIAGRLGQGVSAAAGIVIARAIVRDLHSGVAGARYLSRLVLIYGLAPLIAPLIGGVLLTFTDWRGVFYVLALGGVGLFAVILTTLPETHPVARRQAGSLGATGRTFSLLLRERAFVGFALALGCSNAVMIAYVAASSFVLQDVYGLSAQLFAVLFSINAAAMIGGSQLNAHLVGRVHPRRLFLLANTVAIAMGVGLVLAASTDLGPWAVCPCLFVLTGAWGFIPANLIAMAMADHPEIAGSASAVLGVFQYGIGGLIAPLVGFGGRDSALPMALGVLVLSLGATLALRLLAAHHGTGPAPALPPLAPVAADSGL
jgi:DHA1 family bicyclomycin/chloramphenicol resistance-like MFS transporter